MEAAQPVFSGTIADKLLDQAGITGDVFLERSLRRASIGCVVERRSPTELATRLVFADGSDLVIVENPLEAHPGTVPLLDETIRGWCADPAE